MKEYFPKDELFEKLAAIEHERWADWHKYFLVKAGNLNIFGVSNLKGRDEEGNYLFKISVDNFDRWFWQMKSTFKDLSEEEKDKDREQVMRYWHLLPKLSQ